MIFLEKEKGDKLYPQANKTWDFKSLSKSEKCDRCKL